MKHVLTNFHLFEYRTVNTMFRTWGELGLQAFFEITSRIYNKDFGKTINKQKNEPNGKQNIKIGRAHV